MPHRFAASLLSTLLYAQALLGFAGLASVVLKPDLPAFSKVAELSQTISAIR